jgi:curved DNA-binding protein CbpA
LSRRLKMLSRTNDAVFWILVLSLVVSFCLGFSSQGLPNSRASLAKLSFNEDAPFDDIRVTNSEEVPSDLPKDVAQDTVDETLCKEKTLYEILGARPTAPRTELKRCYFKLAKATHPDALIGRDNVDKANTDDFNDIAAAWRILGDEKLRKRYDFDLRAKAFADKAQRFADEKLEEAAPVVSAMVDNVAATTLAFGNVVGKGMAGLVGLSKLAMSVAKAVDEDKAEKKVTEDAKAVSKATNEQKVKAAQESMKKAGKAAELAARQRTAEAIAARAVQAANAKAEQEANLQAVKAAQEAVKKADKAAELAARQRTAETLAARAVQAANEKAEQEANLQAERELAARQRTAEALAAASAVQAANAKAEQEANLQAERELAARQRTAEALATALAARTVKAANAKAEQEASLQAEREAKADEEEYVERL